MKKIPVICVLICSILLAPCALAAGDLGGGNPVIISYPVYSDVSDEWYLASVGKYGYTEIFDDGSGLFHPNRAITRMEFARTLHKALGIDIKYFAPVDIGEFFDDVKNEDPGAAALYDLASVGIIDRKGSFRPDEELRRDEMIHYVINALNYVTGGDYVVIMMLPAPFDDDAQIIEEYKDDIVLAVLLKLIYGRGGNMLYPQEGATRAESVVIIDRLVKLANDLKSKVTVTASAIEAEGGLKLLLKISNGGSEAVTINHSSAQQYDFKLFDSEGETLYCWSADKLFIQQVSETVIKPGEELEFSAILERAQYEPIRDKVAQVRAYIVGTSGDFSVNPEGYVADFARNTAPLD